MNLRDFLLNNNTDFIAFSTQHLIVILSFALFGFLLIQFAKRQRMSNQILIGNIFAISIAFSIILGVFIKLYKGDFDIQKDLPLHLCSFLGLLLPFFSFTRKFLLYEVLLFLIFAGTSQAILTPDEKNYNNYPFYRYWFMHTGLVIFMFYATIIYKMKPTIKSVFKAFAGMQIYMLLMFTLNYFLGSNYFFTNRKPEAKTVLDAFGDWPYYVFVVELMVIPYFLIIYLPFYLANKKKKVTT
jgi:hypothetical integral membrane protein (TIGR02206 family)